MFKSQPKPSAVAEGKHAVFVSSTGLETIAKTHDESGKPFKDSKGRDVSRRFIYGFINGQRFEVECNRTVMVSEEIFQVIRPLIDRQESAS